MLISIDENARRCPSSNLHVANKTSKPMPLQHRQWTPVEANSALCCRLSLWQLGESSVAAEYVHVLRVSHLWLHATHLDPPDDTGTELPDRNTPTPPVSGLSTAGKLQHTIRCWFYVVSFVCTASQLKWRSLTCTISTITLIRFKISFYSTYTVQHILCRKSEQNSLRIWDNATSWLHHATR